MSTCGGATNTWELLRDLVSRLGFGNGITEPMADNDTIVRWFEEQSSEAAEWRESQRWRDECYWQECPDDEDCYEHDPARRLERADAEVRRLREGIGDLFPSQGEAFSVTAADLLAVLGGERP